MMSQSPKRSGQGVRILILLFLVPAFLAGDLAIAYAQSAEPAPRRTLLQLLFGTPREKQRTVVKKPPPKKTRKKRTQAARTAVAQAAKPVEKLADARKVLVVGDFLAGGLGEGLQEAFADTPGIIVETRTNGSSGLVREDYFNWQQQLPTYLTDVKPALVVISLGSNDRQQMRVNGQSEKNRSEAWIAEYTRRADALAAFPKAAGTPMLWVGMPPFQSPSMTTDMAAINSLFKTVSEKAGGQFIDVWEGFVDEAGKFVITGSDINGQQVRLRSGDGINLTKAGKRKAAFYVEKEIRRILSGAAGTTISSLGSIGTIASDGAGTPDFTAAAPEIRIEDIVTTLPIALTDPDLDGATALLGGPTLAAEAGASPRDLLVGKGEVTQAPDGRIDDFRLSKPATVLSNPVIRN